MVIDERHRGSAREDAAWHEILTYFTSAVHIGLTATPKETKEVSNIHYFGDPLYTYSLRQGIADGFLAPYKVVRVDIDKDLFGWRPPRGKVDKHGQLVEDRIYNQGDMDRVLVLEQRTQLVARRITEFLKGSDRRRTLTKTYASLDDFLDTWTQAGKKKLVMDELEQQSVLWESYSKTKPIRIQEFDLEKEWWGGAERKGREETGHAWGVPVSEIKANNYNLDIKNPHNADEGPGDPDTLLAQMRSLQTDIDGIRDQLKADLAAALEHHA